MESVILVGTNRAVINIKIKIKLATFVWYSVLFDFQI